MIVGPYILGAAEGRRAEIRFGPGEAPVCSHKMRCLVIYEWRDHPERVDVLVHWPFLADDGRAFVIPCAPDHERDQPAWEIAESAVIALDVGPDKVQRFDMT